MKKTFIYFMSIISVCAIVTSCGGGGGDNPPPVTSTYTVTYDGNGSNGGTPPTDPVHYAQNDPVTVLGVGTLTSTGYNFGGWNTQANGSGTNYAPGQTFTMGTSNVTLYAKWTLNPYTFSNDFSGGLSAWTQTDGTWSVVGGYLQGSPSDQSVNIYYNTPTMTTSQWIQAKFKNMRDSDSMGMILWAPSNLSYTSQLYCLYNAGRFFVGYNDSQGNDHNYSPACSYTLADGHYVGFEASGTPSSVTMKIYDNGTNPAPRPWSNPICTWTNLNASGYTYGTYVGLWVYHNQTNYSYDAFGPVNGGDQ